MRKIRFRGQTVDTKELIYGDLIHRPTLNDICIANQNLTRSVSPDTVGQFTGLTDKNGVEIYEGDIVKPNIKHITRNCQVVFDSLCFKLATKEWTNWFSEHVWLELEVIGNIHDNPELLQ